MPQILGSMPPAPARLVQVSSSFGKTSHCHSIASVGHKLCRRTGTASNFSCRHQRFISTSILIIDGISVYHTTLSLLFILIASCSNICRRICGNATFMGNFWFIAIDHQLVLSLVVHPTNHRRCSSCWSAFMLAICEAKPKKAMSKARPSCC